MKVPGIGDYVSLRWGGRWGSGTFIGIVVGVDESEGGFVMLKGAKRVCMLKLLCGEKMEVFDVYPGDELKILSVAG